MADEMPRICDYEGSNYRTDFWGGRGRDYEDRVERQVLAQLLPTSGSRLLEIGAGFGRLTEEYSAYDEVVLLDYSFSQLQYARERLGDTGYTYVAANAYQLPFLSGAFDGAAMIRTIHHFEDVPAVLSGIRRVLVPDANFLLEFANKRNLKALLRHRLGQQDWNPAALEPVEFVELNYNFHPDYMAAALREAGFSTMQRIPVSFLRVATLKRLVSPALLASVDRVLQKTGRLITPSIFTQNAVVGAGENQVGMAMDDLFVSPLTGEALTQDGDTMVAPSGTRWAIRDGIYDFKAPLAD